MANNPESAPAEPSFDITKMREVDKNGDPLTRAPDSGRRYFVPDGLTPYIRKPQEMVKEEKSAADKAKMDLEKLRSIINPQISLNEISGLINPGVSANNVSKGVPDMKGLNNLGPVTNNTYTDSHGKTIKIELPEVQPEEKRRQEANFVQWLQSDKFKEWAKTPNGIEIASQLPTVSPEGKLIYNTPINSLEKINAKLPRGVMIPTGGLSGF